MVNVSQTVVNVNLDALVRNYRQACALVHKGTQVTCVLKSNAYGHGAIVVAKTLERAGCQEFAVSCAREALQLRRAGITSNILVMGASEPHFFKALYENDITITLFDDQPVPFPIKAQLKIDTGFHRLGFPCTQTGLKQIESLKNVQITGLYSHFGLVDEAHDHLQAQKLLWMQSNLKLQQVHICDSIGMVRYPQYHWDRVRIGAFLFGVRPFGSEEMPFSCEETLHFTSTVTRVHTAHKGDYVGYNDAAALEKDMTIATVQVGYGDGYPRRMGGTASVLIKGKAAPVLGLVCMDQMMVDVTGIDGVAKGDVVTLLGEGISYSSYAQWAQTNRNEALVLLSQRPQRVYTQNGEIVNVEDQLIGQMDW